MPKIDWPTLINWIVQGTIGLVFGIVGGYIGNWIKYRFEARKKAIDDEKQRRKKIRASLLVGVSDFAEETQKKALQSLVEEAEKVLESLPPPAFRPSCALLAFLIIIWLYSVSYFPGLIGLTFSVILFLFGIVIGLYLFSGR